jgi:amidase
LIPSSDADDYACRFGLSFLGARFTEEKLIGMAYAFEQRTKFRGTIQPYIVPKSGLYGVKGE